MKIKAEWFLSPCNSVVNSFKASQMGQKVWGREAVYMYGS